MAMDLASSENAHAADAEAVADAFKKDSSESGNSPELTGIGFRGNFNSEDLRPSG